MDPQVRVGDADREHAVAELQRYATEGYLSLDEFSHRSAAVYQATTRGELAAITQDLPAKPEADHTHASPVASRTSWSPVVIAAAVLGGLVLLAAVVMVLMMLGMSMMS